ncbi:putative malate dehydrogenase (decarboxylating) [Helianthus debilis subsp. tardiflorus]
MSPKSYSTTISKPYTFNFPRSLTHHQKIQLGAFKIMEMASSTTKTLYIQSKEDIVNNFLIRFNSGDTIHNQWCNKILINQLMECAPIVYTPTLARVCQKYSGPCLLILNDIVDMIVVTDGSRIMCLGNLGVQGIRIAIGKLDLHVAAAGINP